MTGRWPPAQGHDRWGAGPTTSLAEAAGLLERATDGLRASGDVEWEARAAELYRAAVAEAMHGLVRGRELLDETVRQAAAPGPAGGRPW